MVLKQLFCALAAIALLAGCASKDPVGDNGGMLGLAPVSSLSSGAASVLGNLTGNPAAKDLDERDKALSAEAIASVLQTGEAGKPSDWRNPQSGHFGQITPGPVYSVNDYACRDYVHRLTIGDRVETLRASACRQPDGTWRALI